MERLNRGSLEEAGFDAFVEELCAVFYTDRLGHPSLRSFLDLDVTEPSPDHSTLSRTRRLIDVEMHVSVFTWVLKRLSDEGRRSASMRRRWKQMRRCGASNGGIRGESYEAFVRSLAEASGIGTPPRAELARGSTGPGRAGRRRTRSGSLPQDRPLGVSDGRLALNCSLPSWLSRPAQRKETSSTDC